MLFFLTFYSSKNTEKLNASRFPKKYELFKTDNNNQKCFFEQQIITEGSCDTEDWSNDAENSLTLISTQSMIAYV